MQGHAYCASWLGFLGGDHMRAEEAPSVPDQLCIRKQVSHHPWFYLESSRTASSGLSKSKCRFGWQGTELTRRLNTAWREDQANERTTAATENQTNPATDLAGDESLDVDEVGIGLDGAENMGHDGERGEVGLGFGGLQDITTRKLISTQGNHSGSTGGSWRGQMTGCCSRTMGAPKSRGMLPSLRAPGRSCASSKERLCPDVLMHKHVLCPISQLLSRWPELLHYLLYHWPWGTCAGPTYANLQLCVLLPALLHTDRALSQPLAFTAACFKTYVSAEMNIFLGHKGHSARKQFPVYIFNYTGCVPLEIQVCIRNTLGNKGRMDTHLSETALMAVWSSLGVRCQACAFSCCGFWCSKNSLSENTVFKREPKLHICLILWWAADQRVGEERLKLPQSGW